MTRHVLDVRGQLCPMPVIRTQQQVQGLAPGDELEVLATDPGVLEDIPAWCRVNGQELAAVDQGDEEIRLLVRVREGVAPP